MLRKISLLGSAILLSQALFSQDSTAEKPKPVITGSVDAYYRYNFQNAKDDGDFNNFTSFTNSQNSFELGMASIKIDHSVGKVGGVLDLGFGRRAQEFTYIEGDPDEDANGFFSLAAIKQAYVTYAPSDKVKFTLGKFGTHVGYELLDPQLNRNYSMGYMFSYGPFFHTGLKADFSISDNFSFMLGVANPTDLTTASFEKKFILGQLHGASSSGNLSAYLNFVGGKDNSNVSSSQFDAVVTGKVSDKFSIGYNGTVKSVKYMGTSDSWWGSALYLNVDPCDGFGLTLRGEYFDDKKDVAGFGTSFFATTLSGNVRLGNLTFIPELRLDSAKDPAFTKNDGSSTKSAASFIFAAVYSF
ncbi:MAG: porin [Chitinophagales bacterium]|nr:porin [Chitinophagales bacterium]